MAEEKTTEETKEEEVKQEEKHTSSDFEKTVLAMLEEINQKVATHEKILSEPKKETEETEESEETDETAESEETEQTVEDVEKALELY